MRGPRHYARLAHLLSRIQRRERRRRPWRWLGGLIAGAFRVIVT